MKKDNKDKPQINKMVITGKMKNREKSGYHREGEKQEGKLHFVNIFSISYIKCCILQNKITFKKQLLIFVNKMK